MRTYAQGAFWMTQHEAERDKPIIPAKKIIWL